MKNFSSFVKALFAGLAVCFFLFAPLLSAQAGAVDPKKQFSDTLKKAGIAKVQSPEQAAGTVINAVLTYIGVAVLILIIYAGILWATAAGNDQKIATAKKILIGGVIGLIIIFTASAAVNFVISNLGKSLTGT